MHDGRGFEDLAQFSATERDRGFEDLAPFSATERSMLDALHAQNDGPTPGGDPGDSSSSPSSSDDDGAHKRKKKKGPKRPYTVKNAEMRLPQYPNALTFLSWRRRVRTAVISACEKPERARAFAFSIEADSASFDSLAVGNDDRHRALDAKLADALMKVVRGDLARRLAVKSESLAKGGRMLAGRQILLFTIYKAFAKDAHLTDCTSYSHLESARSGVERSNRG